VAAIPDKICFRPKETTPSSGEEVLLTIDEYEAIRLGDLEGLYQEQAAVMMNISRQTFGRIIESAHRKVADVLVNGKTLKIDGGDVSMEETQQARCPLCRKTLSPCCKEEGAPVCTHCRKQACSSQQQF